MDDHHRNNSDWNNYFSPSSPHQFCNDYDIGLFDSDRFASSESTIFTDETWDREDYSYSEGEDFITFLKKPYPKKDWTLNEKTVEKLASKAVASGLKEFFNVKNSQTSSVSSVEIYRQFWRYFTLAIALLVTNLVGFNLLHYGLIDFSFRWGFFDSIFIGLVITAIGKGIWPYLLFKLAIVKKLKHGKALLTALNKKIVWTILGFLLIQVITNCMHSLFTAYNTFSSISGLFSASIVMIFIFLFRGERKLMALGLGIPGALDIIKQWHGKIELTATNKTQ